MVENILNAYDSNREHLISCLHQIQNADPFSHLSKDAILKTAQHFNINVAEVYGVISYYSMFNLEKQGKNVIYICESLVCEMKSDFNVHSYLKTKLGIKSGEISNDALFSIKTCECLGRCDEAPVIGINSEYFGNLNQEKLDEILNSFSK